MAKKKTKKSAGAAVAKKEASQEIQGLTLFVASLAITLSIVSFGLHGMHAHNWLGVVGNTIGWSFTALFGLGSYVLCVFWGWVGWRLLLRKPLNDLYPKSLWVMLCVVSVCILLSLIQDLYPLQTRWLNSTFFASAWERKIRYHLGGAPFFYLYHDLPGYNLIHIFNALGVALIFSSTLLASILFLLKVNPFLLVNKLVELCKKIKLPALPEMPPQEIKIEKAPIKIPFQSEPEKPKDTVSDFLRYVKLRIPGASNQNAANPDSPSQQPEMLAIQPESNPTARPSLSRKVETEKPIEKTQEKPPESKPDKGAEKPPIPLAEAVPKAFETTPKTRRDAALAAQRVHNGDFSNYKLPSLNLLTTPKKIDHSSLKKDLRRKAEVLEETLLSFGIEAKVGQINCGPTITSFEVHPAIGVKVQKIKTLENDIALNMEAKSIRIIAPIPGKAAVGIEVPNAQPEEVGFKDMLAAYQQGTRKFHIPILLGKAVNGDYVMSDLAKMPHCIIAGATGSGKSVCINTIVMSILLNAKPDEIKLVMVDPKKVELTPYTRLPHMLAPVITEPHGACAALNWLVKEMEKRYDLLKQIGVRNIESFNTRTVDKEFEASLGLEIPEKLPYIVGIIDELADLMMVASSDIETPIARIAQMARAVGIHLILATQRPSREVITGLIKANFPTRISFKVSSRVNSQIVLDDNGAESLLGNGDMLFLPPGASHLLRAQGAFIRDDDINAVVKTICDQAPPRYVIESFDKIGNLELSDEVADDNPGDALYSQALDIVMSTGNASTTFLQRKLKVGYARAASLIDMLEQKGIVGPAEGSKPRKILAGRSGSRVDSLDLEDPVEE